MRLTPHHQAGLALVPVAMSRRRLKYLLFYRLPYARHITCRFASKNSKFLAVVQKSGTAFCPRRVQRGPYITEYLDPPSARTLVLERTSLKKNKIEHFRDVNTCVQHVYGDCYLRVAVLNTEFINQALRIFHREIYFAAEFSQQGAGSSYRTAQR